MRYVIDSYAWIEYFMGTPAGEKVKALVEGPELKITPTICLAEVYAKTLKVEGDELAQQQNAFMKETSALAPLDAATAIAAAKLDVAMKQTIPGWGLADAIVYATGRLHEAHTVTGDQHFKELEDVIFIKG